MGGGWGKREGGERGRVGKEEWWGRDEEGGKKRKKKRGEEGGRGRGGE